MKKSIRLLSVILAVLMLCCSFPLSIFAEDPRAGVTDGLAKEGPVKLYKEDITASGATVELYGTFDNQTAGKLPATEITGGGTGGGKVSIALTSPDVGTLMGWDRRQAYYFEKFNENMAIKFNGSHAATYMNFFDHNVPSANQTDDLVYHMDVKTSKDPAQYSLYGTSIQFRMYKSDGSTNSWLNIEFKSNGNIVVNNTVVGQLGAENFTSIGFQTDMDTGTYYVYINGALKYTGTNYSAYKGGKCTIVRVCQINTNASNIVAMDNDLWFDNMILYTKADNITYPCVSQMTPKPYNTSVSISKEAAAAAGHITFYGTFDNQTEGADLKPLEPIASNGHIGGGVNGLAMISPDVGSLKGYDRRKAYTFEKVDGNMAIKLAGTTDYDQMCFFDFTIDQSRYTDDMVFHLDVKSSKTPTDLAASGIIQIKVYNGSKWAWVSPVSLVSDGSLKCGNTVVGKINPDEYTSLALRTDTKEGKYYVYVNGILKFEGENSAMKSQGINAVRVYQVNTTNLVAMDNDLYFDNMIWYSNPDNIIYVGEQREKTQYFYSTFDYLPESSLGVVPNNTSISAAARGENGVNGYGNMTVPNYASSMSYVKEADGNIAIKSSKGDANNLISGRKEQFITLNGGKGLNYYIEMDIKSGETTPAMTLFQALSRYNNSPFGKHLVAVTTGGSLYTNQNGNVDLGKLSKNRYTKIAVYVDIANDKYYVWVDGINKTPDGMAFFSAGEVDKYLDGNPMNFSLEAFRQFQKTDTTTMNTTDALYIDNILFYGEKPITGEGFFEYGGYVYYRQDGQILKNGIYTLGESTFKFDAEGRLLKTIRTPIGAFKSETTNELGVGVDTLKLVDEFKYDGSYPKRVTLTPNSALDTNGDGSVTFGELGDYKNLNIEFNAYTDKIYENSAFGFFIFCNYKNSSNANVNSYYSTWITLGTKTVVGYIAAGTTNSNGNVTSYGTPRSIDGWTTFTVKMGGSKIDANVPADTKLGDIGFLIKDYATSAWLYNEDGTERVVNTDYTAYFSSVNVITYGGLATSLDDITGSGWLKFLDDGEYYYAPWTNQRLVGKAGAPAYAEVKIDGEKLVCAFDENGKYTLATGKVTVNGKTNYYKDGKSAVTTAGYTVSMNGNVDVNFLMIISEQVRTASGSYLEFTKPNGMKEKIFLKDVTEDASGYYKFTCGVAAAEMTDDIKLEVCDGSGIIYTDFYSVVDYATAIIDGENAAFTTEAKNAVMSMLNYGAYAQLYFDRKLDNFANAGLGYSMDPSLNPIKDIVDINGVYRIDDAAGGATYVSSSISLLSTTSIVHYFTVSGDVSNYTFTFGSGANAVALTPVKDVKNGVTRYYVELDGIPATKLDEAYTVTVANVNDASDTITVVYSALAYADLVIGAYSDTTNEKLSQLVSLMKAMYQYYEAAAAYADSVA